jgi:hypothetical protein
MRNIIRSFIHFFYSEVNSFFQYFLKIDPNSLTKDLGKKSPDFGRGDYQFLNIFRLTQFGGIFP